MWDPTKYSPAWTENSGLIAARHRIELNNASIKILQDGLVWRNQFNPGIAARFSAIT
jgi:hypothetical protein